MRQQVSAYIQAQRLISKKQTLLVALSGGADSVALLCVLHDLGYQLQALHCNFHLRGQESDRDEQFVRQLCDKRNIALHVKHFDTMEYARQHQCSIEMAARDLRYGWFRSQISAMHAQGIAVAHHIDDQAETLLLNLTRGTGLRGMAGMWPSRDGIIRPLLCVSRQDILDYLTSISQDYVTDSTNLERDALRNRIRLDVMPMLRNINPQAASAMAALCHVVQGCMPYYQAGVWQAMNMHGITKSCFPRKCLARTDECGTLLHEWLRPMHFNAAQQAEMQASANNTSGRMWKSDTHIVLLDREALLAERREKHTPMPDVEEDIVDSIGKPDPYTAYFDADMLTMPLHIRRVTQGDRMVPFGMKGQKLVSDLMTDKKLNLFQKQKQCVVTSGNDIIWLIGLRSDNRYRVTADTKRILRLRVAEPQQSAE